MRVKDWDKHQHYKKRRPPWIRLYRDILDDREWHKLDGTSAKVLIMLWLVASEDKSLSGNLPENSELAWRLRMPEGQINTAISKLSHWLYHDASKVLAGCEQDIAPEERRGETETEEIMSGNDARPHIPYLEIVSFLNEKVGAEFKHTTQTTKNHIKARWNEGFRLEDFRTVIQAKSDEWLGDDKMCQYLRPQTLFGTNFEGYLVAASSIDNQKGKKIWKIAK